LKMGAGAFVCGEETALMASIEGKRGMPRARPPVSGAGRPGRQAHQHQQRGNLGQHAPDHQKRRRLVHPGGHGKSKGTKIFSLAGKVNNTGLVEVPIGTTIKEIIFDIGGGIPKGRKFKAVQMGGPSGGCVPAQFLNLPIDYDTIQRIGAIMGSGGMVVMDENNCMVEIARSS
jgi:NADH-quinone oxidoreductase subunit F